MISFTEQLRRLDDADLTPHQFRLLVHYWRVGHCWESIRTTAMKCGMSKSQVYRDRRWLLHNGWISQGPVEVNGKSRIVIKLVPERDNYHNSRPSQGQKPGPGVPTRDAILNEPLDLNEPLEERETGHIGEAAEDEAYKQIAWAAAVEIMDFWCDLVSEVAPRDERQRRRLVQSHYLPFTRLWQRLDGNTAEAKRLLKAKYEEMLRKNYRPRRPKAVLSQINGDLYAATLPANPAMSAIPASGRSSPITASEADQLNRRLNAHLAR